MQASKLTVINTALDLVEEAPIQNIDSPKTTTEQVMLRHYDQRRRALLRKHAWNFATKRAVLPALEEDLPFGYWNSWHELPADYIRFCGIGEDDHIRSYYQIENNRILMGGTSDLIISGSLPLRYVYDFTNIPKADPLFLDCLALEIAVWTAGKIAAKESLKAGLVAMLKDTLGEAYSIDGQDRPPIRIERSRALESRRGHRNYSRNGRAHFGND